MLPRRLQRKLEPSTKTQTADVARSRTVSEAKSISSSFFKKKKGSHVHTHQLLSD